jgi:type I restriction enzyme R subunit
VILVVDRTELEGQLKGWVEKLLGEMQQQDISVCGRSRGAASGAPRDRHARPDYLDDPQVRWDRQDTSTRDNVYVFIDEAHRRSRTTSAAT